MRRERSGLIIHLKSSRNFVNTFSMLEGGWVLEKFGGGALPVVAVASAYEYFSSVPGAVVDGREVDLLGGVC